MKDSKISEERPILCMPIMNLMNETEMKCKFLTLKMNLLKTQTYLDCMLFAPA